MSVMVLLCPVNSRTTLCMSTSITTRRKLSSASANIELQHHTIESLSLHHSLTLNNKHWTVCVLSTYEYLSLCCDLQLGQLCVCVCVVRWFSGRMMDLQLIGRELEFQPRDCQVGQVVNTHVPLSPSNRWMSNLITFAHGGYVFTCVCLSVCQLTGLFKNSWSNLYKILWNSWT